MDVQEKDVQESEPEKASLALGTTFQIVASFRAPCAMTTARARISERIPSRAAPGVALVPETAILGALVRLIAVLVVGIIAFLPMRSLCRDRGVKVASFVLVHALFGSEGVIEVVDAFGIVWLRPVWVETFADPFFLSFFRICVARIWSAHDRETARLCIHKMFLFDFVPARSSFLSCSHALDVFCIGVFHDEINKLTLI